MNTKGAGGFISHKAGKISANITGPTTVVTTLLVLSPLVVESPAPGKLADVKVQYTLINALFCGEDDTVKQDGRNKSSRRDRFTVQRPAKIPTAGMTWPGASRWRCHGNLKNVSNWRHAVSPAGETRQISEKQFSVLSGAGFSKKTK
jgi:hypothetical protein